MTNIEPVKLPETAPYTQAMPGRIIEDPANWTGEQMMARSDWLYKLDESEIDCFDELIESTKTRIGGDPDKLRELDETCLDLGGFAIRLENIKQQLFSGCGLALIDRFPVDRWSRLDTAIVYWTIGRHIGTAVSNNPEGDLIAHVTDKGRDYDDPTARGYQTRADMYFHTDQCDLMSLLCLHAARSGGETRIASSIAIHNEMIARRPDLVDVLAQPFYMTRHSEKRPGQKDWYRVPAFNYFGGFLSTVAGGKHLEKGHALPDTPDISEIQKEAIELFGTIGERVYMALNFEPGQMALANNYTCIHRRTAYEEWPDRPRRELWRLWLRVPEMRPIPRAFENLNKGVRTADTQDQIALD